MQLPLLMPEAPDCRGHASKTQCCVSPLGKAKNKVVNSISVVLTAFIYEEKTFTIKWTKPHDHCTLIEKVPCIAGTVKSIQIL